MGNKDKKKKTLKQLLRTIPSREIFVDKYAHANESTHQTELEYKPPKKLPFNQYIDYEAIEDSDAPVSDDDDGEVEMSSSDVPATQKPEEENPESQSSTDSSEESDSEPEPEEKVSKTSKGPKKPKVDTKPSSKVAGKAPSKSKANRGVKRKKDGSSVTKSSEEFDETSSEKKPKKNYHDNFVLPSDDEEEMINLSDIGKFKRMHFRLCNKHYVSCANVTGFSGEKGDKSEWNMKGLILSTRYKDKSTEEKKVFKNVLCFEDIYALRDACNKMIAANPTRGGPCSHPEKKDADAAQPICTTIQAIE